MFDNFKLNAGNLKTQLMIFIDFENNWIEFNKKKIVSNVLVPNSKHVPRKVLELSFFFFFLHVKWNIKQY